MLFLYEKLFQFKNSFSPLCSFNKCQRESVFHLFSKCDEVNSLWTEITDYFSEFVQLIHLTLHIAFLGCLDKSSKSFLIQNLVLVVFELYINNSRVSDGLTS